MVHLLRKTQGHFRKTIDCRVKPGNDGAAATTTSPVTRGLDPRAHLLRKNSLRGRWMAGSSPAMTVGRASRGWRALLCWRATITPLSPLSRMARIAIIALMLFVAAPALAQQSDTATPAAPAPTAPPAQTDSSKNAPHPDPLPAGGERERTETPAPPPSTATETPPSGATDTSPAAAAPAAPPPPARAGNVDVRESLCLMIES